MYQVCKTCRENKALDKFYRGNNKNGLDSRCKSCESKRRKHNYQADYRRETFNRIRNRAKVRGQPFNITLQDIPEIPTHCPILGLKLEINWGGRAQAANSPTLDRAINDKGYIPGNVVWVSAKANRMKGEHTVETLRTFLEWMCEYDV